ncbi:MAG: MFS transporter [Microbacteriaceae bacterium]|nr:MFS transporter [Microbacteriaceae bacterium]MCL2794246.1 MFS transporter [Microbacteriaceae bacterium]
MTSETDAAPPADCPPGVQGPADGILSARYRWITIGMCALVLFVAFEAMAVTTVMPVIARELRGASLYTLAFSGSAALSVVGMVVAGAACDRRGPVRSLVLGVLLFVVGLAVAGLAPTMGVLVAGRLVQGFGGGALTVSLYVAVARWYPARLHPMVFVGFSTAWVLPSLIGPFVAGVVTEAFGWRWIFLGVIAVALSGLAMIRPVLVGARDEATDAAASALPTGRVLAGVAVAAAMLLLGSAGEFTGPWRWAAIALAAAVLALALRVLLPAGSLRAATGLPAVMTTRMLITGAELSCEVYVPYLLIRHYGLSPAIAGLALTGGAVAWSGGSWLQGRLGARRTNRGWAVLGAVAIVVGIAGTAAAAAAGAPPVWVFVVWVFTGFGMGVALPRLSVLMIGYSTPADRGFNSAAQAIADAVGGAGGVAVAGIVFVVASAHGGAWPFAACFAFGAVLGLLGLLAARRVGEGAAATA